MNMQEQEIEKLKNENALLTLRLRDVLLSIDTVKEMNAMCSIDEQRKHAVKDFAERLKEKLNNATNGWVYMGYIDELLKEYE